MDATKQDSESATAILKEWMGEAKKKPKKEAKTNNKEETDSVQKEPEPQKKKKTKAGDEMSATKTTIKRKLAAEPPEDFSPAPAVVDARVNLMKAQLISEVEDAVEKVREEEQEKASKVRKPGKTTTIEDASLEDELELSDEDDPEYKEECTATEYVPQTISVQAPNVPLVTIYVCTHWMSCVDVLIIFVAAAANTIVHGARWSMLPRNDY